MQCDPVVEWQARVLPVLKRYPFAPPCTNAVTLFTPWLWMDERFDLLLDSLLASILMTWRVCGKLPVNLLVNRVTPSLSAMADKWGLALQVEPNIKGGGGNVRDLNCDSLSNLGKRFDTEYVLTFQNHAFPIREGLNTFIGKYDYIGAPWAFGKDDWITRFLLRYRGHVGNGAFAIRSRRLCETIAWYYCRKYKYLPYCYLMNDDYFIGKTLLSFESQYRKTIRIAPPEVAATFSLEDNVVLHESIKARPFGFHGAVAFARLQKEGQVPDETVLATGGYQEKETAVCDKTDKSCPTAIRPG